jgi:hypothetical protein
LLALVENPASVKLLTMKADGDQSACRLLRCVGEWLLALALAEIQLRQRRDCNLDYTVGQLPWNKLIKPDTV